ncbi:hypothetical protein DFH07DRAFT_811497 [Mycena maculata]|uniref:Uncharacterized protein n=1 Tax=Mycena maculata TaxID=230809 RepID=A0AAD7NJI6_9AGAR|nr:hypothetical protein DFH07DRAFT_811497 [Mycena maculata]
MSKRKQVPHALHSELSEYSSLLRALSANDNLGVAKHITHNPPKKRRKLESSQPAVDVAEGTSDPPPEAEAPKRPHVRKRDTWTRWPLLVQDVKVPEWGLADEIETLVRTWLQNNPHRASQDADEDPPSILPHVVQSASNFLSGLLALIAQHTPARPQSLQERINPIGWQTVLAALASSGDPSLVDPAMLSSVQTRLEAIYGPCSSPTVDRLHMRRAIKARTGVALDEADDTLLAFARPQKRQPRAGNTAVEDNVDSDDLDE